MHVQHPNVLPRARLFETSKDFKIATLRATWPTPKRSPKTLVQHIRYVLPRPQFQLMATPICSCKRIRLRKLNKNKYAAAAYASVVANSSFSVSLLPSDRSLVATFHAAAHASPVGSAVRRPSSGHLQASLNRALAPSSVSHAEVRLRLGALGAFRVLFVVCEKNRLCF